MSTQVVFTGTAKNDLREIAVHLAKRSGSRELAVRFVRELQEQTAILAQFPESGAFPQDRMLKSSGFPFSDAQGLSAVLPVRKSRGSGLYHGHFPRQARLPARHAAISVT